MAVIHAHVLLAGAFVLGVAAAPSPLCGQEARPGREGKEPSKYTKSDVRRVIGQLAHDTHAFRSATRRLVDPGDVEDLAAEERLDGPSNDLEKAIDRLRTKVDGADDWWKALKEASDVVLRSVDVNARIANVYAYTPVRPEWLAVRKQVNALARIYELHELAMPIEPPKPQKPEAAKQPQVHP